METSSKFRKSVFQLKKRLQDIAEKPEGHAPEALEHTGSKRLKSTVPKEALTLTLSSTPSQAQAEAMNGMPPMAQHSSVRQQTVSRTIGRTADRISQIRSKSLTLPVHEL